MSGPSPVPLNPYEAPTALPGPAAIDPAPEGAEAARAVLIGPETTLRALGITQVLSGTFIALMGLYFAGPARPRAMGPILALLVGIGTVSVNLGLIFLHNWARVLMMGLTLIAAVGCVAVLLLLISMYQRMPAPGAFLQPITTSAFMIFLFALLKGRGARSVCSPSHRAVVRATPDFPIAGGVVLKTLGFFGLAFGLTLLRRLASN